ncbi:MAG TPA: exodeoxyribonuclease VII small subunit [Candidatus Dormibacteraeota bacterium]|nr:exodeoxyribonuclease VII small subunit [Candidatus Dormibacteraeota bacterium]
MRAVSNTSKGLSPSAGQDSSPAGASKDLPFEEALQKLESIVDAMEAGDLPLEALLAKFEEGTRLVKSCQAKLEEAELKISRLEKSAGGELQVKPAPDSLLDNE